MKLKIILRPEPVGGYSASVPALPGCYSEGETLDETLHNIREAAELWLEVDRSAEARDAFMRVTDAGLAGRVALGMAQALERLDDVAGACDAFRRAAASPLVPAATERAKFAVIRLKCAPEAEPR